MAVHWIVFLAALIPFWFLQNVIHELAHGLTMWLGWGWKFKIWPFPSNKLGSFTFAHVLYEPTATSRAPSNRGRALVSIMPKIINGIFITISAALTAILASAPTVVIALFALFAACNLIDFSVGMVSIFRKEPNQSDLWRFKTYIDMDTYNLRWLAAGFILLGWLFMTVPTYILFKV